LTRRRVICRYRKIPHMGKIIDPTHNCALGKRKISPLFCTGTISVPAFLWRRVPFGTPYSKNYRIDAEMVQFKNTERATTVEAEKFSLNMSQFGLLNWFYISESGKNSPMMYQKMNCAGPPLVEAKKISRKCDQTEFYFECISERGCPN
jgi:hypothetical protein